METDITPNRGAEYTLVVEDCTGDNSQQPTTPGEPGDDDTDRDDDDGVPSNVAKETIPEKKLPNTGGLPLVGLLLFGGAGLATAGSLLGVTSRRNRR